MRDIFCSIGEEHIVADLRIDGNHSIDFIDEVYDYPNELETKLQHILEKVNSADTLYLTATFEPAYFLRKQDIPIFRSKNSKGFFYRSLPSNENSVLIYAIPQSIQKFISDISITTYYLPTLEVLLRNFQASQIDRRGKDAICLIYMVEQYLHLLFQKEKNKVTSAVFKCENATDVLYYTLLVAKENNIPPEQLLTIVGGRGKSMVEAEVLLKKYMHSSDEYFQNTDHKRYFDLKGMIKCES